MQIRGALIEQFYPLGKDLNKHKLSLALNHQMKYISGNKLQIMLKTYRRNITIHVIYSFIGFEQINKETIPNSLRENER